jgi:hypothetical protein
MILILLHAVSELVASEVSQLSNYLQQRLRKINSFYVNTEYTKITDASKSVANY